MIANLKKLSSSIAALFDFRDVMFFLGLILLGYGIYLVHPPSMYIVLGAIFIVLTLR